MCWTNANMVLFLMWSPIFMLLHNSILCNEICSDTKNVTGALGEGVILQVGKMAIKDVIWNLGENVIAITYPATMIRILSNNLKDKWNSTSDGSLQINCLTEKDQAMYTATISTKEICKQRYFLSVYKKISQEDIIIHPNVIRKETCNVTLTCTVNGPDVSLIWIDQNGSNLMAIQNVLSIQNVVANLKYTCKALNPISSASKTVTPGTYCKETTAEAASITNLHMGLYFIPLLFAFIVAFIVVVIIIFKRKRKLEAVPTVYAQVQNNRGNMYKHTRTDRLSIEKPTTIYSQVEYPQRPII